MTFCESVERKQKYILTFGTECDPSKYALEDDPDVTFIRVVAQCCLESGKPCEDMNLVDVNNWLARRSHRLRSHNQGDEE
jgi:hypothetical protein